MSLSAVSRDSYCFYDIIKWTFRKVSLAVTARRTHDASCSAKMPSVNSNSFCNLRGTSWKREEKQLEMADIQKLAFTVSFTFYSMTNRSADSSWVSTVMESKHMHHRCKRFQMGICCTVRYLWTVSAPVISQRYRYHLMGWKQPVFMIS